MFVRWQRRNTSPTQNWRLVRLGAVLVESVRIEGTPRALHVAHLGNIIETRITDVGAQCRFWENVVRKLDTLHDRVTAEKRQQIERAIADRVPCPTRGQYDQFVADRLEARGPDWAPPAVTCWPR
jgi:hypothetical protein